MNKKKKKAGNILDGSHSTCLTCASCHQPVSDFPGFMDLPEGHSNKHL